MKTTRKSSILIALALAMCTILMFTACGSREGQSLEEYMKDHPTETSDINAELGILNADAKVAVQYEENKATVTVQYYAMTDKAKIRCENILNPVMEQFEKETGNTAEIGIKIEGHSAE